MLFLYIFIQTKDAPRRVILGAFFFVYGGVVFMNSRTKKITTIGMMCAMAMVMNLLLHFPIIPAVSFFEL